MNRERIIELAVETGVSFDRAALESATKFLPNLERFAHLIAAETREKCARICDVNNSNPDCDDVAYDCAKAIREVK